MSPARVPDPRVRRVFWSVFLGAWLLQLAWVLAVPAFRGIDEIDHVLRADSLVHGQLRSTEQAADGRGQLVAVRPGTLGPAIDLCRHNGYTGPDDCRAVERLDDGRVLVGSAAGTYNPTWYAVAGTVARAAEGTGFATALRLAGSTLCALLLAAAAAVTVRHARTPWPWLALAVCATPTLVYSSAIAAPNGAAYAAGLLWWSCAAAVVAGRPPPWGLLTLASFVLLVTHTLDVVWVPLMVLAVLSLQRRRWWTAVLTRRQALGAVATVAATGLASVGWILASGTNITREPTADAVTVPLADLATKPFLWVMQTVAAYPMRNEPDSTFVYAVWLLVVGWLLVLGVRHARGRERAAMALVAAAWLAVPLALTVHSYADLGFAWQGRYALPLVTGLPVLAGAVLEERGVSVRRAHVVLASCMLALVQVWAPVALLVRHRDHVLTASLPSVLTLPVAVVVVTGLALAGLLALRHAATWRSATPSAAEHRTVAS